MSIATFLNIERIKISLKILICFFLILTSFKSYSINCEYDTLKRKRIMVSSLGGVYLTNMGALYNLWYKDYKSSGFHFYNDSRQWLGVDKAGHVFSAFVEAKFSSQMLEWAGFKHRKAVILGCSYSFLYQTTFEVFDGYSAQWGFSPIDVAANSLGTGLVLSQQLIWNENRIKIKYSYYPSSIRKIRPDVFGKNFYENLLKDYNGQTYWLNVNPRSFLKNSKIPDWLDISFGYGASGMYGGDDNIWVKDGITHDYTFIHRKAEFYLSPDINLEKLKVKKKWIKLALNILNSYKIPLPALKYSNGEGFKFLPIMF